MLDYARWKMMLVLGICLLGVWFAAPNLASRHTLDALPDWLPKDQVNLGLDLQGGSHLLLEVDTASLIKARLELLADSIRDSLRNARSADGRRIGYTGLTLGDGQVTFALRDPADAPQVRKLLDDLAQPVGQNLMAGTLGRGRDIEIEIDGTAVRVALTQAGIAERKRMAVEQSIEVVRRRVDMVGTREPVIQRQGDDRIVVQVPGLQNPEELKALFKQAAKLEFRLVDLSVTAEDIARGRVPPGSEILPMADGTGAMAVKKRVMVSGDQLRDAQPSFQQGLPVVAIRFDTTGGKRFADVTKENVGRPFAIVLDGKIISAPRINEPILGGAAVISGSFTVESANQLAVLLRSGALPADLTVLEERTVGPGLGADSVAAGRIAAVIGLAIVVVFMVMAYGLFGLFANAALLMNVVLIFAALSALGATLTLPGIAGIVLTIGMAVDANVIIFERIRDEIRAGRTPFSAMDAGFRNALSTIWDANITTLIATALMFQFGSGPVKGFAVTLTIGVVTSVFSALMLTRLMLVTWLRRRRPAALPI
ncbi:MAG: protein translocase subunit SecD [Alphaproteobacteria bacterium]|nr:MAG: protein translocase subunit SecD [Alphaproteobacteria bacterium]